MILDTTFLIDFLRNEERAVEKLKELEKNNVTIAITTPTIAEIWTGLTQNRKNPDETEKTLEVIKSQIILELDLESAKIAGQINGELLSKGESIGIIDSMIASISKFHNETLLTRNVKHFERIQGLKMETY